MDNLDKLKELGWDCIRAANYLKYKRREQEKNKKMNERYNERLRQKNGVKKPKELSEADILRAELAKLKNLLDIKE